MGIFKKKRAIVFLYGALGYTLFFGATTVQGFSIANPLGPNIRTFTDVINSIAYYATVIIGPLSILMVLYAALLYLFAAGNVEKVKKAHQAILWALVGLGIVLVGQGWIYIIKDVLSGGSSQGQDQNSQQIMDLDL